MLYNLKDLCGALQLIQLMKFNIRFLAKILYGSIYSFMVDRVWYCITALWGVNVMLPTFLHPFLINLVNSNSMQ